MRRHHPCSVIVVSGTRESWPRSGWRLAAAAVVVVVGVHVIDNDYNLVLVRECVVEVAAGTGPIASVSLAPQREKARAWPLRASGQPCLPLDCTYPQALIPVAASEIRNILGPAVGEPNVFFWCRRSAGLKTEVSIERGKKPPIPSQVRQLKTTSCYHYSTVGGPTRPARNPNNWNDSDKGAYQCKPEDDATKTAEILPVQP
ncbi:hypothetical protein EDB83DRAFT_2309515 [Lactarius deliciosus]|nr:hypothetical protein EDB83DRAFT_2309515 [Lactarius deliciosus]